MKLKAITPIFLLLFFFCLPGVTQETRGFTLDISAAPSIPIADYGDKDIDNDDAGFAKLGGELSLFGTYMFEKSLGISVGVVSDVNFVAADEMSEEFELQFTGSTWSAETDPIYLESICIGPTYRHHEGNISIDISAGPGFTFLRSPEMTFTGNDGGGNELKIEQESGWGSDISLFASGSFSYWFKEARAITIGINYLYSHPIIEDVGQKMYINGTLDSSDSGKVEQKVHLLSIPIGLRLKL